MPRTRTIYNTQALYVSQAPAVAMQTGNGDIKQLSRIQNFDEDFVRNYTEIFQYGTLGSLGQLELEEPTVSANFSYYLTNGWNEKLLGLDIYPSESIDNYSVNGVKNNLQSCISNFITKTADEKNYYLLVTEEGNDAVGYNGLKSGVIGIGNGYITSYTVNASVGGLPTAEVEIEGLNVRVYDNISRETPILQKVNKIGGYVPTVDLSGEAARNFGASISLSQGGRLLFVGDAQGQHSGVFYVFTGGANWNNGANYTQRQRTRITGDLFNYGANICSNETGNVVVIGASNARFLRGDARIYTSNNFFINSWTLHSTLSPDLIGGYFGTSVAISSRGDIITIGRPDIGAATRPGAVHILTGSQVANNWAWDTRQIISGDTNGSRYGSSVAMSESGNIIIMGGPLNNPGVGTTAGAAIIFTGNATNGWAFRQKLSGDTAGDAFGTSIATNSDGSVIVMGGNRDDDGGNNAGAAKVYTGNAINGWVLRQKLPGDSSNDLFGSSVSTNSDGSVIVMGGTMDDDGGSNAGAALIFTGNANNGWKLWQKITGDSSNDQFGTSVVSITNSSGDLIMMGSTFDSDFISGGGAILAFNTQMEPIPDPIPSIDVKNNISTSDKFFALPAPNTITGGTSVLYSFVDNASIGGYNSVSGSVNTQINKIPSVLLPGDVMFSIPSGGVLGFDPNDLKIQDFTLTLDLARSPIRKIGNRFAFSREIDFPVAATLEINAEIGDISDDNLVNFLCDEKLKNFNISIKEPGCDFNKSTAIAYLFRGARLVSQSISKTIGDNGTMSATYEVLLGGPNDFSQGVFISGSYSNRCPIVGNSPWLKYSFYNQGGTQFPTTGWLGPLPPAIGGYASFVGGYFQGLIDEFLYPYSQFKGVQKNNYISTKQFNPGNWEGFSNIFTGFSPSTGYLDLGNGGFMSVRVTGDYGDFKTRWWSSNQIPSGLTISEKNNFITNDLPTAETINFYNLYLQTGSNESGAGLRESSPGYTGNYFGYLNTGHRYLYFQVVGGYNSESFSRNFVEFDNLNNHGFGPQITFQRNSHATYFGSGGLLRYAPHNILRNSQASGLIIGPINAGGSMPTYWALTPNQHNVSSAIVGSGLENNLPYIDLNISGTPSSTDYLFINLDDSSYPIATTGQTWTSSVFCKIESGRATGISVGVGIAGRLANGNGVEAFSIPLNLASGKPFNLPPSLITQRNSATMRFDDPNTVRALSWMYFLYTSGVQIGGSSSGIVFRIAAPQLERNLTPSEYIPTSGAAKYDQPRFDYNPITLKNNGLLIEGPKTNFVPKSEAFNAVDYWFQGDITVSGNVITAPDGTLTADAIYETTGFGYHVVGGGLTPYVSVGSMATISVFAKANGRTQFAAQIGNTYGQFDLLNETATVPYPTYGGVVENASIIPVGNGWFRCSYSTSSLNADGVMGFVLRNNTDTLANPYQYSGNPTLGMYFWGAQVESGRLFDGQNFVTSYIPTFSGIETREEDIAFVTPISSFYNQDEGTLFGEASQISNSYGFVADLDNNNYNRIAMSTQFYKVDGNESFNRDFSASPTLNHGLGPSISFTRNSIGTYFDQNGIMQIAPSGVPRFDYSSGNLLGLLIEESRTNSVENSIMSGITTGVYLRSGEFILSGILPTYWQAYDEGFGSIFISETGIENGMNYIDFRLSVVNTGVVPVGQIIAPAHFVRVPASSGQTWTSSVYIKLISGNLNGIDQNLTRLVNQGRTTGYFLTNDYGATSLVPKTGEYQRISATVSLSDSGTQRISQDILIATSGSSSSDIALRIAAPQLELGSFATSYIPTSGQSGIRDEDSAIVTPISGFYNQNEGTLLAETIVFDRPANIATISAENDENNRMTLYTDSQGTMRWFIASVEGGLLYNSQSSVIPNGSVGRIVGAYQINNIISATNGSLATPNTSVVLPTVPLTHFFIGRTATTFPKYNGHIRKIVYWPKRLSNSTLQQLTSNTPYNKDIIWSSPIPGTNYRHAYAYKSMDYAGIRSGSALEFREINLPVETLTYLRIGGGHIPGPENLNGYIRKVAYYPRRLNNTLLQNLVSGSIEPGNLPIIHVSGVSGFYNFIESEFGNCIGGYGETIPF